MFKRLIGHIIIIFTAVAFVTPRVINLHALEHLSDDEISISCELCDIAVHSFQQDLDSATTFFSGATLQPLISSVIIIPTYQVPQEKIVSPTFIYNKPPPIS